MVEGIKEQEGSEDPPRQITVDIRDRAFINKTVAQFATKESMRLLQLFKNDVIFPAKDQETGKNNPAYLDALQRIEALVVGNNFADRGVATMQNYNLAFTEDEGQKQYLLQIASGKSPPQVLLYRQQT